MTEIPKPSLEDRVIDACINTCFGASRFITRLFNLVPKRTVDKYFEVLQNPKFFKSLKNNTKPE